VDGINEAGPDELKAKLVTLDLYEKECEDLKAEDQDLIDAKEDDPEGAALAYFTTHIAPKSASSLRFALKAARLGYVARMGEKLQAVEDIYLNELMQTRDAVEGLNAFIAKRPAKWENR